MERKVYDLAYYFNKKPEPCPFDHEHTFLECFKLALECLRVKNVEESPLLQK